MTVNYTHSDVIAATNAAHKAIQRYSRKHHVCAGCLTGHVVADMLFHVVKNCVADELLPDYRAELNRVWDEALADRNEAPAKPGLH